MPLNEWDGLRDDLTIVGDGMLEAQNCSFRIQGELRRRPGLDGRLGLSGVLTSEFTDRAQATYAMFVSSAGAITSLNLSSLAQTTLKSALSTAYRGTFARSNQRLYYSNDFDPMQVVELGNSVALEAGIAAPSTGGSTTHTMGAPTSATTGVTTVGAHLLRYRYYNSRSGYYSNPSMAVTVTLTGAATLTVSIGTGSENIVRSTDTKADQVVIEMTAAGASAYYQASVVNQSLTGTTISMADASLILQVAASTYGEFGHEKPPLFAYAIEHRGRIFGFGATVRAITGITLTLSSTTVTVTGSTFSTKWAGRMLQVGTGTDVYPISSMTDSGTMILARAYSGTTTTGATVSIYANASDLLSWSRAGYPESWKPLEWGRRVMQNASDVPSGLMSYHDVIWLFGQRTMRLLDYPTDPATGTLEQIPTEMGLWNQRCLIAANGYIYGWGRSGAWVINGMAPAYMSKPVDARLDGTDDDSAIVFDPAYSEKFFGYYDPKERCLTWVYVKEGDTVPKNHVSYDLDSKKWRTGAWRQSMLTATLVAGVTNNVRVLISDENGYSWYVTENRFDGVPVSLVNSGGEYTGVVTVATTGATTTSIPVAQALPTGSADLIGAMLYHPTTSGTALVQSNTADTITLATALSAAPTIGTELYLGSFPFLIKFKWIDGRGMETKKRPCYLMIKKVPGTSSGKVRVRIYEDFSASPFTFTADSDDTRPDGVAFTSGAQFATVDLDGGSGDGIAYVPLSSSWKRTITASIEATKPDDLLRLLEVRFVSESQRSEVDQDGE